MKPLHLEWGNPEFLQEVVPNLWYMPKHWSEGTKYNKQEAYPWLQNTILALHKQMGNADDGPWHVVVGSGITQVLASAIWAVDAESISAPTPHYHRFPDIAMMARAEWHTNTLATDAVILTTPNNPTGETQQKHFNTNKIYDLCYNWPMYTKDVWKFDGQIGIYGLSKFSGHAGTRIGWALVKNKRTADRMNRYIELATCGVSFDAQERASQIIEQYMHNPGPLETGRRTLLYRWQKLRQLGAPLENNSGMFIWTKDPKWWYNIGVVGIPGNEFGVTNEYMRLNIGCSSEDFAELIKRIEAKYGNNRKSKRKASRIKTKRRAQAVRKATGRRMSRIHA